MASFVVRPVNGKMTMIRKDLAAPSLPPRQRSDLASPTLVRDFSEPVQSMADGKWYSSKRALAASHKASGNPYCQDFIELGNDEMPWREHQTDEAELVGHIKESIEDVKAGRLPDVLTLEE